MVDIITNLSTLIKFVLRSSMYIQNTETSNHKITSVRKLDSSDISLHIFIYYKENKQKIMEITPPLH